MKNNLDNYIRICLGIISGSIFLIILMAASIITYVIFFDSSETTQIERRQEHVENHIKEAEKLGFSGAIIPTGISSKKNSKLYKINTTTISNGGINMKYYLRDNGTISSAASVNGGADGTNDRCFIMLLCLFVVHAFGLQHVFPDVF